MYFCLLIMAAALLLTSRLAFIASYPRSTFSSAVSIGATSLPLSIGVNTTRTLSRLMSQLVPSSESDSDPRNDEARKAAAGSSDEVLVQYVVLRRDLIDAWPMGSVVTQGCHASVAAIWSHKDDPHTLQYCSPQNIDSMHKVTLEVKGESQILNLSEKLTAAGIVHKLWIEQPENIPTCLATKPYPKSTVASSFKKLKLCK